MVLECPPRGKHSLVRNNVYATPREAPSSMQEEELSKDGSDGCRWMG
jgi:hypothetical protein